MLNRPTISHLMIYDVSAVIYAGNSVKYTSDFVGGNDRLKGVAVGGVRRLLQNTLQDMTTGCCVVWVFDSKTDKREYFPGYKAQRTLNTDVEVQKSMAIEIAERIHIPYIKVDGYEADDLVAAIVKTELQNFSALSIVTGDMDLAANLIDRKVRIIGAASMYPSVDVYTYESLIKSGQIVKYNTVLPYFFFMGKPSNNVPAISKHSVAYEMYKDFVAWASKSGHPSNMWSSMGVFAEYLLHLLQTGTSEETIQKYAERMKYIFPKDLEVYPGFELFTSEDFDRKQLLFFTRIFGMQRCAALYGLGEEYYNVNFTKEMSDFLVGYRDQLENGTIAASIGSTPDMSFFVNRSSHFTKTDTEGF